VLIVRLHGTGVETSERDLDQFLAFHGQQELLSFQGQSLKAISSLVKDSRQEGLGLDFSTLDMSPMPDKHQRLY
jgi:hypothetical protein